MNAPAPDDGPIATPSRGVRGIDRNGKNGYYHTPMACSVQVQLGSRSYPIEIGEGLLGSLGARCRALLPGSACLVVSDSHVAPLYASACMESLRAAGFRPALAEIPAGEPSKDATHLFALYDHAARAGLDRKALVVALGGGVVGDLAGFMAATWLRGVRFVQVPTTLLAMVDSAVGGKTGINLPHGKNLVGAFHQPSLVLADLATLKTLPRREYLAGLAEVMKYGVIVDAPFFDRLERDREALGAARPGVVEPVVARCCEIKAEVVAQDERESGRRALLNFGHTMGHAIENVSGYGRYLHGEAVAMGMVFAARLSVRLTGLPAADAERLERLLAAWELPVRLPPDLSVAALRRAMALDKKTADRVPYFVLAEAIGRARPGCPVPEGLLEEVAHGCR